MTRTRQMFLVLALCLMLVLVYLVIGYWREQMMQRTLIDQIDNTRKTLMLIEEPPEGLQEHLERAIAENESAKALISGQNSDVNEVIDLLLKTAAEHSLRVNPVSTEQWIKRGSGAGTYRMLPVEMTVAGVQSDFIGFLYDLENRQLFPELVVEEMTVIRTDRPADGNDAEISVKLNLSLVVSAEAAG